ncbi:MAG: phosphotransferase [Clostridia bacterium]|nr:phosphotransferase [Clostridia bacterium]
MIDCTVNITNGVLRITAGGRLDSAAAPELIAAFSAAVKDYGGREAVLDLENCEYITSACLRAVLILLNNVPGLRITGARSEVYDILEVTGFTEMLPVERALKRVSVEGCEMIGSGAQSRVYRLSPDTVVKVYRPGWEPDFIMRSRELARRAFVLGVPTAIPLDVVRVGDGLGILYELLKAESLSDLLASGKKSPEECGDICAGLMKRLHGIRAGEKDVPAAKDRFVSIARSASRLLEKHRVDKLVSMIEAVPETDTLIHGDLHINNIMMQDGEPMLIDLDSLRRGHPVLELSGLALSYNCYSMFDPENTVSFFGVRQEIIDRLWNRTLHVYLDTEDEKRVEEVRNKSLIIALTVLICRAARDGIPTDRQTLCSFNECVRLLGELLDRTDTLEF